MSYTTIVLASALLIQTVYGQCLNSLLQQASAANYAPSLNYAPSANYAQGLNLVSNGLQASNGLQVPGCSYIQPYPYPLEQSLEALSVSSGSYSSPGSISVYGENLSIGGEVNIAGSVPFMGTVAVSGAVPTSGQAQVSYNSAPGVTLSSGGCGQGVSAGSVVYGNTGVVGPNVEVSSLGLAGLNGYNGFNNVALVGNNGYNGLSNVALVGNNGFNNVGLGGNNLIGQSSCGCGYAY